MKKIFEQNEQLKADVKRILPETLAGYNIVGSAKKSGIVCPNCGNGLGEDGTGIIPTITTAVPVTTATNAVRISITST